MRERVQAMKLVACCNYFLKKGRLTTRMDGMLMEDKIEEDWNLDDWNDRI